MVLLSGLRKSSFRSVLVSVMVVNNHTGKAGVEGAGGQEEGPLQQPGSIQMLL